MTGHPRVRTLPKWSPASANRVRRALPVSPGRRSGRRLSKATWRPRAKTHLSEGISPVDPESSTLRARRRIIVR